MDSVLQEALPRQIWRKQPFAITLQMMNERKERLSAFQREQIFCRASSELLLFDSLCNTWALSSSCTDINEITLNESTTEPQNSPGSEVTCR